MSTPEERKVAHLQSLLKSHTRRDGSPLPGRERKVASLRAELDQFISRDG